MKTRQILASFILCALTGGQIYAGTNSVDLNTPGGINESATIRISLSARMMQLLKDKWTQNQNGTAYGSVSRSVGIAKCEDTVCQGVPTDLTGKQAAFVTEELHAFLLASKDVKAYSKDLILRPGSYKLYAGSSVFRFELKNKDRFEMPLVEVYLPRQGYGSIEAKSYSTAHNADALKSAKENNMSYLNDGYFFPVSLNVRSPLGSWLEQEAQNANLYMRTLCRNFISQTQLFPLASQRCSQVLSQGTMSREDFQYIRSADVKLTGLGTISSPMVSSVRVSEVAPVLLDGGKRFADANASDTEIIYNFEFAYESIYGDMKKRMAYLNSDLKTIISSSAFANITTKCSSHNNSDSQFIYCDLYRLQVSNQDTSMWSLKTDEAVLVLPGQYTIRFKNESGQTATQELNIGSEQKQIDLTVN